MIYINRRPLTALVYQVSTIDGHLAPVLPAREQIALANGAGIFGSTVTQSAREIRVGLDVRPSSLADRQTLMDRLRRRFAGLLELTTDDLPGRVLTCVMGTPSVELYPGSFAQPACWVELPFVAVDPARWDLEPLLYGLSTTARTVCPIGAETSAPLITIVGACTNPAIVVRNARGDIVSTTTFTLSMGANDALTVDSSTEQITRTVAGVVQTGASSGLAVYTSGALPLLAPEDGDTDGQAAPSVQLTAASGTPTGTIEYRRRW